MPKSLFPEASPEVRQRLEQDATLKLFNEFDWSSSPLGQIIDWPESLKGAVRLMMVASTPMVMMVGKQGTLIYNNAYAGFAGNRHPEIFGMGALEAWPEIADFNRDNMQRGLRDQSWSLRNQELVLNRHGVLESAWLDLNYSPVVGPDGKSIGTLCVLHETTDRVLAQRALARSEERLSLALGGSSLVGTWDWDVEADVVTADEKFADLYNLDPLTARSGVPVDTFLKAVHPEDVARVNADINASLADGSPLRSEYRLVNSRGEISWVIASGSPRMDAVGKAKRFPGVVFDVSEQRRISDALAESEQRFRTLADTMPQMVWSAKADGKNDYLNKRWHEFTGTPEGSSGGDSWREILHPDDRERASQLWRHSLETGEQFQIEYRLKHHSGAYRWALGLALPIRDARGQIIRWFGTCTDIHETRLVAEERELVAQELNHRIKNLFAVITGIISLSARSRPEAKAFAEELRHRIHALGQAHDIVRLRAQANGQPGDHGTLKSLIMALAHPHQGEGPPRVNFSGIDHAIDDGAATPLGLLFHELCTNASKYGALSVAPGHVDVTGSLADGRYRVVWQERGGPPAIATGTEGFGSRLINLSVEGQLRGSLTRKWDDAGLRVEIEVPTEALMRSAALRN